MNNIQNILAEFQNLVFNSEEKPSSHEAASVYKHTWGLLSDYVPRSKDESDYKDKCLTTMKQIGTILGISEEGVITFPHIEQLCEEIYDIESFGEDLYQCLSNLKRILNDIDDIENKELEIAFGVAPHYMVVKLNCMREQVNRLITEFTEEKSEQ